MRSQPTTYADYQATTPVDPRVLEAMSPYRHDSFGNPHSSDHIIGWRAAEEVDRAAKSIANLIGAAPDEIIFTSGATESKIWLYSDLRGDPRTSDRVSWSVPLNTNAFCQQLRHFNGTKGSRWNPSPSTTQAY